VEDEELEGENYEEGYFEEDNDGDESESEITIRDLMNLIGKTFDAAPKNW